MIARQAHFLGRIEPGAEAAFYAFVRERLVPMWQRFPGLERLEVLYPVSADPGANPIALTLTMYFADEAALAETLASTERVASRQVTEALLTRFDGRIEHHVMAVEPAMPVREPALNPAAPR